MKKYQKDSLLDLTTHALLSPKEQLKQTYISGKTISIGVPKEINSEERRISFTPQAIKYLTGLGIRIQIEKDAGENAHFSNLEYSEAGAEIIENKNIIYQNDIIVKVLLPSIEEIELLKPGNILLCSLDIPHLNPEQIKGLMKKKTSVICFENMKDESGVLPVIQSMSEIAGNAVIFIAAEYLSGREGRGILFGGFTGIPPSKVVIIGAGTVGQHAAKTAISLGAEVKIFDKSVDKLRKLRTIYGLNCYNAILQPEILSKAIRESDILIGAIRSDQGITPKIVTTEMIASMQAGSVAIDVSIDQGGCFETSEVTSLSQPVFIKHGVIHYCVPNIPGRVPGTSSVALSNILTPLVHEIIESGTLEQYLWEQPHARSGVCIYRGILTNSFIGSKFNISNNSLDILLASNL